MEEIYHHLNRLLDEGKSTVRATIIRQAGPSPRAAGTQCLILEDGSLVGTIGGGPLEARTLAAGKDVLNSGVPMRLFFSLTGTDVAETDMLCGGEVEVFLEPVTPDHPGQAALFREAETRMKTGGGVLVTLLNPERWQERVLPKMFITRGGKRFGELPGARSIEEDLVGRAGKLVASRQLSVSTMKDDSGDPVDMVVEPVIGREWLYVFGGGHVSRQIVPLASRVNFYPVVIDDRKEFSDPLRFPDAEAALCYPFENIMERLEIRTPAYMIIVTRGHMHDMVVLAQALKTDAAYIGMIGSTRKRDVIYEKLLEEGFTQKDLRRVHSPIGLDIGAETPEEIAVSIVAQLIQVRAGREV